MKLNQEKQTMITELIAAYGEVVTRKQVIEYVHSTGITFTGSKIPKGVEFPHWITNTKGARVGRGHYNLSFFLNQDTATPVELETTENSAAV